MSITPKYDHRIRRQNRQRTLRIFLAICVVVILTVLYSQQEENTSSSNESKNDDPKTMVANVSNVDDEIITHQQLSHATDETMYDAGAFRETEIQLILEDVSSQIHQEGTPQYKAYRWLVHDDQRKLQRDDVNLIQRYVLALVYFSTNAPEWTHGDLHWLSTLHECHWHKKIHKGNFGVMKCNRQQEITQLFLVESNLQGSIPTELKHLSSLSYLDLQNNVLTGTIPKELGDLTSLTYLGLSTNQLEGNIPESFGNLINLEHLLVNDNQMSGTVPKEVCGLFEFGVFYNLWADCGRSQITCSCCTVCCESPRQCGPNNVKNKTTTLDSSI